MREPHREGLASHPGPESCAGGREGAREALTGEDAGEVLSSEIKTNDRGADPVETRGRQDEGRREGEAINDPAESETLSMRGSSLHGNREVSRVPNGGSQGRLG